MNSEIQEPGCQRHFLSLRFSGIQFSRRRVPGQKDFSCLTAHCGGMSRLGHIARTPCRSVTEAGASALQKQETSEQLTLPPDRWRQSETQTTTGSPWPPSVLCWTHLQERDTGKRFLLLLITALNCKKITTNIHRSMPFALLCRPWLLPGVSGPNSCSVARFTGAPVLTSK